MSFTNKNKPIENKEEEKTGMMSLFADMFLPALPKMLEKATGQKITSNSELLLLLMRIERKIDDLREDCKEQFIEQAQQLNSIQQVTKLVSTEKTKEIHLGKQKFITEE